MANAVLAAMGDHPEIPRFQMYSEVIQDSVIELVKQDRCGFVSGVSLTVTDGVLQSIYDSLDSFRGRLLLRPPSAGRSTSARQHTTAACADLEALAVPLNQVLPPNWIR